MPEVVSNFLDSFGLTYNQKRFVHELTTGPANNVLYGGRGGVGKTRTLVITAVYLNGYLRSQGYTNIRGFFGCMDYTQFEDRIGPMFVEVFGDLGEVSTTRKHGLHWRFNDESMGVICFRNLEDPTKRKGSGFAYILVDELTEVPYDVFGALQYLRLQRTERKLPFMPFGAATNPDGIGHGWVKTFWVPGYQNFDLETTRKFDKDRFIYIHASHDDNPTWNEAEFDLATAGLSESTRKARKEGLWNVPEGARWPSLDPKKHQFNIRKTFPLGIPSNWPRILGIDFGTRAPFCCLWIAIDGDRNAWVYREVYESGITPDVQAQAILDMTPEDEQISRIFADNSMWAVLPNATGRVDLSVATIYRDTWGDAFPCGMEPGLKGERKLGWAVLDAMLNQENDQPNLYISEDCTNLWGEFTNAVWDTRGMLAAKKEDIDPRNPDHALDALKYALRTYYEGAIELPEEFKYKTGAEYDQLRRQEYAERAIREFRQELERKGRYRGVRPRLTKYGRF